MNLSNKISELLETFERWAESSEVSRGLFSETLASASRYAFFSGGKRVRPLLSLFIAEMLETERERLKDFVIALELIHTSSLIHDDLPGLDNDDFRRGKPTCHKVFGEGTAVIAGDFLIAKAFSLVSRAAETESKTRASWAMLLSEATMALCDGQGLDLEFAKEKSASFSNLPSEARAQAVLRCHQKKTGALFQCAAVGPVEIVSWGRSEGLRTNMERLGEAIGALFQMTDDLLDSLPDEAGKGVDLGFSVVAALGRQKTEELVKEKLETIEEILSPFGQKGLYLKEFVRGISKRTN